MLARLACRSRFTDLVERAPRGVLLVVAYHRVGDPPSCPYDREVVEATPEQFAEQISYIKSRFYVAHLSEDREILDRRQRIRSPR